MPKKKVRAKKKAAPRAKSTVKKKAAATSAKPEAFDSFLSGVDREAHRAALRSLREAILAIVPHAQEGTSYGMPSFFVKGKAFAGLSSGANHCAFYPMSGGIVGQFEKELAGFKTSKGAIQFQPEKPLSKPLLKKLIQARLAEIA